MNNEDFNHAVEKATLAAAPFTYAYIRLLVVADVTALALVCGTVVTCKYLDAAQENGFLGKAG